jgi:hypothetical protein
VRTRTSPIGAIAVLLALVLAAPARADHHDLTIADAPTSGVAIGLGTFVPTDDDAVLDVADLQAALAAGDVMIDAATDGGPGAGQTGRVTFADGLDAAAATGTLTILAADAVALPPAPLALGGGLAITAPSILTGAGTVSAADAISLDGPVTLGADTSLRAGGDLGFTGTVDGPRALDLQAGGRVVLPADVGATTPPSSLHVLGGTAVLGINGSHRTVATAGDQRYDGPAEVRDVTVDARGGSVSFLGPTLDVAGALSLASAGIATATLTGAGRIVRDGPLSFTLAGDDDDPATADPIELRGGTLVVASLQHRSVQLRGGTLVGAGPIGDIVDATPAAAGAASAIAPAGAAIGTLSAGSVDLGPRTTLALDLAAGSADRLAVTGTATLDATRLEISSAAAEVPVGVPLTVLADDGADPVAGRFAGLPDGATLTAGAITYKIDYFGGDGNDVTLTRQPAPAAPFATPASVTTPAPVAPPAAAIVAPLAEVVVAPPRAAVAPAARPTLTISGRRVTATCPRGGAACALKLSGRAAADRLLVTTTRKTPAAGRHVTITLALSARGRARLRAHHELRVAIVMTARAGSGAAVTLRRTLTLR